VADASVDAFDGSLIDLTSDLYLQYSFDPVGYTIADITGNGHDANAGSFSWVTGKNGNALQLDGAFGYLALPGTGLNTSVTDWSVSVWVNPMGLSDWQRVFDFGHDTNQYFMVTAQRGGGGHPLFSFKNGDPEQTCESTIPFASNTWQNLIVTQSGTTVTMYIDGTQVAQNTNVTREPQDITSDHNFLGKSQWPDPKFNGAYDDFRFYTRVFTAQEITDLAAGNTGNVSPTGLRVGYDFEDTGFSTADSSGANMTGSIGGIYSSAGHSGQAITFDSQQGYLRLPPNIVNGIGDFTVATWFYEAGQHDWARIFDWGNDTGTFMFLCPNAGTTQTLLFSLNLNGNEQHVLGPHLSTGTWYHLAVTRAGTTATIYVNGTASGSGTIDQTLPNTVNNYIGRSMYPDPLLDGSLDDFRFYKRALSAAEIAALANL
jgi:hypothetical protein